MSETTQNEAQDIPEDALAVHAPLEVQRQAARMAQDGFTQIFRLTVENDPEALQRGVNDMLPLIRNWAKAGGSEEARHLRLALLVAGLDQWGLAYSQAFGLNAIPGLTELLGALRTALTAEEDARFLQMFDALGASEGNAIDFKVDLRRGIHLSLWHAMIASEDRDEATHICTALGSLMLALVNSMPVLGWRLVADALAHVQIRCLAEGLASDGLGQEMTQQLFAALQQTLPAEIKTQVFTQAAQVALAWQQARRQGQLEAEQEPTRH
ncbi:hypothetical protein DLREEDagrD3_24890 [Denitratisoma sp. agr-D3]